MQTKFVPFWKYTLRLQQMTKTKDRRGPKQACSWVEEIFPKGKSFLALSAYEHHLPCC